MAMPLALPAAGAMVILAAHPREPLCDGLVEGTVEGFYLIQKTGCENSLFIKQDDLFYFFTPPTQLDCPQTIDSRPPCAPHRPNPLAHTPFVARACFWLVVAFI